MNSFTELYYKLAKFGDLSGAKFLPGSKFNNGQILISALWKYRNISRKSNTLIENKYIVNGNSVLKLLSSPIDSDILLQETNKNGDKAYIMQNKDDCSLFINYQSGISSNINLKDLDLHGKVYNDPNLAAFAWSEDCTKLAYIAEKKISKSTSFFTAKSGGNNSESSSNERKGEEYEYVDDYGEQMEGQHNGIIVVVNATDLSLKILEVPDDYNVGNVRWTPDGYLYGICYKKLSYRLGMIYCPNRPSIIFKMDMDGHFSALTNADYHVKSPRLSPDGEKIIFIRCPLYGPHVRAAQLCKLNVTTKEIVLLIDYVSEPIVDANSNEFHGIDSACTVPNHCFLGDSNYMFLNTRNYFDEVILVIDIAENIFKVIKSAYSQCVLDVQDNIVLIKRSSFAKRPQLYIFEHNYSNVNPKYIKVTDDFVDPSVSPDWIHKRVIEVPHPKPEFSHLPVPYMYIGPKVVEDKRRPLITLIHGGPHSMVVNSYSMAVEFFINLGYSVIIPNYRGSLGQGRTSLESLPGFIGRADVDDVQYCVKHCIEEFKMAVNADKVFLSGGSHGGFLVSHMSAQFPDLYKVVVTRNPVIDVAAMYLSTDIPDWTVVEAGFNFQMGKVPSSEVISKMYSASPFSISERIKAPTLFLLGKLDRRVPYGQGLKLHKHLLSQGVPTQAYIYEDCHPLAKVDVEADCLIHQALWYDKYGNSDQH